MPTPFVFITRQIASEAIERLREKAEVEVWLQESPPPKTVLLEKIAYTDGILTMLTDPIDSEVIQAASSSLKVISQMAVGFDNIDIAAATRRRIPVGHTPGVLTETTADFAWALILAAARRIVEADRQVRQGIWKPWGPDVLTGLDVYGATLGIIGFGRIGQAVAQRAKCFNMHILYYSRQRKPEAERALGATYVDLEEIFRRSDILSLHLNYTPAAHHLVNRERLALMKPTAILINTARGAVVDSEALVWALQNSVIAGAALDVFDPEPIPHEHPLLQMENVILTPHIASASRETRRRMALMAVENVLAGLEDRPLPYCANPEVYS
ncbi:D-glycerate dehydrogenase [uncultured Thermanaerothrix sp.]|uniref:2-hydroxyacid dehydrogenase n=1 Tax=uncultured Thermanaerothrix sp. TaxID=1195149 RepID=UPI00262121A4|nr:D-glycerate dehydrogenase [uncultured Thermanaerothrix sp.]